MGLFTSPSEEVEFVEPAASIAAREQLLNLGQESINFPGRTIADLTEAELEVERQALARLFGGPSELTQLGLDLTAAAAQQTDPLQSTSLQAIISEALRLGQLETNRVGRGVQIVGAGASTTGRDILGRSVGQTEAGIVTAATPLISQQLGITERARTNLIGAEEGLELNRLSLGSAVGELRRSISDAQSAASLEQFINNINFRFGLQAGVLQSILVNPQAVITGGGPSEIQRVTGHISQIAPFFAGGAGGGGGGAGSTGAGQITPIGSTTTA